MTGDTSSEKQPISAEAARDSYGITAPHEKMPNGELRFRLMPGDGNGYIRTVGASCGQWQSAHSHRSLRETYIVESGWIASAEKTQSGTSIRLHFPGDVFTTETGVVHNIYMSANSVIHTVKHGGSQASDWEPDIAFTEITRQMDERSILSRQGARELDPRFASYMDLYNSLDKLVWTIPGFLAIGATLIVGFLGSIIARDTPVDVPPLVVSLVLSFSSLLFYLGYVSMTRLREHHNMVGDCLAAMEHNGYFAPRCDNVRRRWPLSAPTQFRITYAALSLALIILAIITLLYPGSVHRLLSI